MAALAAVAAAVAYWRGRDWLSLTRSSTAQRLGLSNQPDSPQDRARLKWLAGRKREVLRVLRGRWPAAHVSSGYRSGAVNAAIPGASPTSRHRHALALDIAGISRAQIFKAARHLRTRAAQVQSLRKVIAETTPVHLHMSFWDPLKIIDTVHGGTTWLHEPNDDGAFQRLA